MPKTSKHGERNPTPNLPRFDTQEHENNWDNFVLKSILPIGS